jgi:hypothetical protein
MRAPKTVIVNLKTPEVMAEALKNAAQRKFMTKSEYVRRAVMQQMERDGIVPVFQPAA